MEKWRIISALFFTTVANVYGQHEFTGKTGDKQWGNPENWKEGTFDPAFEFPDEGQSAKIATGLGSAELGKDIVLTNLDLQGTQTFSILLGGNSLTVNGTLSESGATHIISGGTLVAPRLRIDDLILQSVDLSIDDAEVSGGGFILNGTSKLTNQGSLKLLASGGISGDSLAGLVNRGRFEKIGNGTAMISKPFKQEGGQTVVSNGGTLLFTNSATFEDGTLEVGGNITFNEPATVNGVGFEMRNNGRVQFHKTLNLGSGTFQSSTVAEDRRLIIASGGISGGNTQADVMAPLVFEGGEQAPETTLTNFGGFVLAGGRVRNLVNEDGGKMSVESIGTINATKIEGVLTNYSELNVNSVLPLLTGSKLRNLDTARLLLNRDIYAEGVETGTELVNTGTIVVETPASEPAPTVSLRVPLTSSGQINVNRGSLNLGWPATLSNEVTIKHGSASEHTRLTIGGTNQPQVSLKDINFRFLPGPGPASLLFLDGNYDLEGILSFTTSGENGGSVSIGLRAGTWTVNKAVNLSGPVKMGGNGVFPTFNLLAPLEIGGLRIESATVYGEGGMSNKRNVTVDGTLRLGSQETGTPVVYRNFDFFFLSGKIEMIPGSRFQNRGLEDDPSLLSLRPGARVVTATSATLPDGALPPVFQNQGVLRSPSEGSANIDVEFEQGPGGCIIVDSPLRLNRTSYIKEGSVDILSNLQINGDAEWGKSGKVYLEFFDRPQIGVFPTLTISGSDSNFSLFSELESTGEGCVELVSGTMKSAGGGAGFNTCLNVKGGILGDAQSTFFNKNVITQTGGTMGGTLTNGGTYFARGGTISGTVFNSAQFTLDGTTVSGTINHGSESLLDEEEARLIIRSGRILSGGKLDAEGSVEITGSLVCDNGSSIEMGNGRFQLIDSSSISGLAGASAVFGLGSEILARRFFNQNPTGSISMANLSLQGTSVDAREASLSLQANNLSMSDVEIFVGMNKVFTARRQTPSGSGLEKLTLAAGSQANFIDEKAEPAEVTIKDMEVQGKVVGLVRQTGRLTPGPALNNPYRDMVIEGSLAQDSSAVTTIFADLFEENSPKITRLRVLGDLTLGGSAEIFMPGLMPGDSVDIISAQSISGTFDKVSLHSDSLGPELELTYHPNRVTVTARAQGETYDDWQQANFDADETNDPAISGMDEDPDADGNSNWHEYLHDTNPKSEDSRTLSPLFTNPVIETIKGETFLRLDTKVRPNLSGVIATITNLGDLTVHADEFAMPGYHLVNPDDPSRLSIRCFDPLIIDSESKSFLTLSFRPAE